jgi:hypothetical protein
MPAAHGSGQSVAAVSVPPLPHRHKYVITISGLVEHCRRAPSCRKRMPAMTTIPLAACGNTPISAATLAERSPPSRARRVFLLQMPCVCTLWLRSPLERSHTSFWLLHDLCHRPSPSGTGTLRHSRGRDRRSVLLTNPCARRMAGMTAAALLTDVIIVIFVPVDVT